ncbi:hypothetical protein IL306_011187, partial [Fusarium sp. DS 682]
NALLDMVSQPVLSALLLGCELQLVAVLSPEVIRKNLLASGAETAVLTRRALL